MRSRRAAVTPFVGLGRLAGRAGPVRLIRAGLVGLTALAPFAGLPGCAGDAGHDRPAADGFAGRALPQPLERPDFVLADTDGQPFDFREETQGYVTLLFFGYTHCPDVCPVHMANLAAVLRTQPWEVRERIRVIFVSVDPERDSRVRIREWLADFDPSFVGLRGERERVNEIMAGLGLPPAMDLPGESEGPTEVGHAAGVLAFSRDGPARRIYPFGTRQVDWARDLPRLVREGWPGNG
jgi:protein SCO1/2